MQIQSQQINHCKAPTFVSKTVWYNDTYGNRQYDPEAWQTLDIHGLTPTQDLAKAFIGFYIEMEEITKSSPSRTLLIAEREPQNGTPLKCVMIGKEA